MSTATRKGASSSTRASNAAENDPKSPKNLDPNTITSTTTTEAMIMAYLVTLQETVNKQGEDLRALAMENGTLRVLVVENEHLKKVLEMQTTRLMQLENEVQECKRSFVEMNALKERLTKAENDYALKEEKMDTMRRDVSEMKDVSKSWADVCNGNVVSGSPIMQAMAHTKNVENVDAQELRERERRSKNIVIRGIVEEKLETPPSLAIAIEGFFNTHFGMSGVTVYGAHRVGKQGVSRSGERSIVCTMVDETKRKIILDNSWVYLKGTGCFVYEDRTLMQQNARRKAYEERSKRFKEQSHEEKTLEKEATPCNKEKLWIGNCSRRAVESKGL
ncbi:hypothetical protein L7F22_035160 [Adiantum nelumboides]|nr:hypothetical protein [Adiantum nelumboides]